MHNRGSDPYPCWELINFWRDQPGGLDAMPEHVKDYIIGQNAGVWPLADETPEGSGEDCPF